MIFYTSPWAMAALSLIVGIHTLCPHIRGVFLKIAMYVNIGLHLLLVGVLLLLGAELAELVVLFVGSLALYLGFFYVASVFEKRERRDKK